MTVGEAAGLQAVLSEFVTRGKVTVAAGPAGARIVIKADGAQRAYDIRDADAALLRHLLTGRAD